MNIYMSKVQRILPLLILSLLLVAGCSSQEQKLANGELVIPGTGACQHLLRQLATAFNATEPGFKVVVPETTGSNGGIRSVQQKQAILGRVARPFRDVEKKSGLQRIPFARDAIVFVTGARVAQKEFTVKQLASIFSGEISTWQQEDGSKQPIRVIARPEGDSSLTLIRRHLSAFTELNFSPEAKIVHHDTEMVELLNKYSYSIGFLSRSSLLAPERTFNAVKLAGMPLTESSIRSTAYPMAPEYALIHQEGTLPDAARKFIDFIRSAAGRKILENAGMIPLLELP